MTTAENSEIRNAPLQAPLSWHEISSTLPKQIAENDDFYVIFHLHRWLAKDYPLTAHFQKLWLWGGPELVDMHNSTKKTPSAIYRTSISRFRSSSIFAAAEKKTVEEAKTIIRNLSESEILNNMNNNGTWKHIHNLIEQMRRDRAPQSRTFGDFSANVPTVYVGYVSDIGVLDQIGVVAGEALSLYSSNDFDVIGSLGRFTFNIYLRGSVGIDENNAITLIITGAGYRIYDVFDFDQDPNDFFFAKAFRLLTENRSNKQGFLEKYVSKFNELIDIYRRSSFPDNFIFQPLGFWSQRKTSITLPVYLSNQSYQDFKTTFIPAYNSIPNIQKRLAGNGFLVTSPIESITGIEKKIINFTNI